MKNTHNKDCMICKNHKPFEMPEEIIDSAIKGKLTIFAGAGISTENNSVLPFTFYDEIKGEMNLDNTSIEFDKLMSLYVNGRKNGRRLLLQKIFYRFDRINAFSRTKKLATRFHNEIATIPHLNEIFTTNWDNFFETECKAIPIVTSEDYVFSDIDQRKIYKLHGSINNIGTIIATTEDYNECYKKLSKDLMGSSLKLSLSANTVVFIGYSLRDFDFQKIFDLLKTEMGDLIKHSFIVTTDAAHLNEKYSDNITPIITDGTFFIHTLKNILNDRKISIPDINFDMISIFRNYVLDKQEELSRRINFNDFPEAIYSAHYLEGINHACQFISEKKNTGQITCANCYLKMIDSYFEILKNKKKEKNYLDVAYIDGYIFGLLSLLELPKNKKWKLDYYIYNYPEIIKNISMLKKILRNGPIHKGAYNLANKVLKNYKHDPNNIIKRDTILFY